MNILLLIVLLAYLVYDAISGMQETKELANTALTEKERVRLYRKWIIWGWVPTGIIFVSSFFMEVNLKNLGIRKVVLSDYTWLNIIVFLLFTFLFTIKIYAVVMYFISGKFRKKLADEIEKSNDNAVATILTPRTLREKQYWFFESLTAGVCEEITFRGCMMFLLANIFPDISIFLIAVVTSIFFGLLHFYQGLSGVIGTGLMGLLFAGLYIATDSVIPGIILHFLWDFTGAFVIKEENAEKE